MRNSLPYQKVTRNDISSANKMVKYVKLKASWSHTEALVGVLRGSFAAFYLQGECSDGPPVGLLGDHVHRVGGEHGRIILF